MYRSYNSLYYAFALINTQFTSLRRVLISLSHASSRIVSSAFTAPKTDLLFQVPFQIQICDNCLSTVPPGSNVSNSHITQHLAETKIGDGPH